jgi:hypothetical protein
MSLSALGPLRQKETATFRRFFMELAGLEPATSWVRFTREASPSFASVRGVCQPCGLSAPATATVSDASSPLLDQNLTIGQARRRQATSRITRRAFCNVKQRRFGMLRPLKSVEISSDELRRAKVTVKGSRDQLTLTRPSR